MSQAFLQSSILMLGLSLGPLLVNAGGVTVAQGVHIVAKGDTLTSIARRHHTTVAVVKATNGLKSDVIRIGQAIILPPKKAQAIDPPKIEKAEPEPEDRNVAEESAPEPADKARPLKLEQLMESLNITDRFRLQVYLDGIGFAPGKVDGLAGEFTVKAVSRWMSLSEDRDFEALFDAARRAVKEPIVAFEIPAEAAKFVGEVPTDLEERAASKTLPYATVAEYVAERFHTDEATLSRLNNGLKEKAFAVGMSVKVPAVRPFLIESPRTGNASKERIAGASLRVLHLEHLLEVCDPDGQLLAVFPITVGTKPEYVRPGAWKVTTVAPNPNFMWDEEMLKHGRKGTKKYLLPPGPNNPVGVLWLELQPMRGPEAHIGIHGTNDPTHIGRNHSSGCIRLANWDIVRLSRLVGAGTQVVWEPQPEGARVVVAE
jgi:lipoprotein-anchoring transpeptidase ErfK/SrfK